MNSPRIIIEEVLEGTRERYRVRGGGERLSRQVESLAETLVAHINTAMSEIEYELNRKQDRDVR